MDRSLDDVIAERQTSRPSSRPTRDRRPPRDGIRKIIYSGLKPRRDDFRNLDRDDWLHDRFDEDSDFRNEPRDYGYRGRHRRSPVDTTGAKLRVENLHYDLTEEDLRELFTRIGPIREITLLYDKQDRSRGTAYVTYKDLRDAQAAVQEFDGANARGQPIRLTHVPMYPGRQARNPFDNVEPRSRSLFERIEEPTQRRSPEDDRPIRHSDVSKPPPEHIDRYVPGQDSGNRRRRSPAPRRSNPDRGTRRPGQRRQPARRDGDGHMMVQGRPRKTVDELDAEMADYWGGEEQPNGQTEQAPQAPQQANDGDIDMVE